MSAIDGKYVKINNQWQAWMGLRREARGLQAPLQVVKKVVRKCQIEPNAEILHLCQVMENVRTLRCWFL